MTRTGRGFLAVLLLSLAALGCPAPRAQRPQSPPEVDSAPPPAASSEAERTRRMEEQARDMKDRWQEVQTMEGSDADKERAVQELLEKQQELNREGEGTASSPPPE